MRKPMFGLNQKLNPNPKLADLFEFSPTLFKPNPATRYGSKAGDFINSLPK
jgi:hypothetical protein